MSTVEEEGREEKRTWRRKKESEEAKALRKCEEDKTEASPFSTTKSKPNPHPIKMVVLDVLRMLNSPREEKGVV